MGNLDCVNITFGYICQFLYAVSLGIIYISLIFALTVSTFFLGTKTPLFQISCRKFCVCFSYNLSISFVLRDSLPDSLLCCGTDLMSLSINTQRWVQTLILLKVLYENCIKIRKVVPEIISFRQTDRQTRGSWTSWKLIINNLYYEFNIFNYHLSFFCKVLRSCCLKRI